MINREVRWYAGEERIYVDMPLSNALLRTEFITNGRKFKVVRISESNEYGYTRVDLIELSLPNSEIKHTTSLYDQLSSHMKREYNENFHLDKLGWTERVIISELCNLIDKRLNELMMQR